MHDMLKLTPENKAAITERTRTWYPFLISEKDEVHMSMWTVWDRQHAGFNTPAN